MVSISSLNLEAGLMLPQEGEKLQILGDISQVNNNPRVQKALKRLATAKAPTSLSQLVMWRVATDLDWNTIAQLSQTWANRHELTLAQDFVDHLDDLTEGETGRLLFEVEGTDAASKTLAAEFTKALQGKMVLGLIGARRERAVTAAVPSAESANLGLERNLDNSKPFALRRTIILGRGVVAPTHTRRAPKMPRAEPEPSRTIPPGDHL